MAQKKTLTDATPPHRRKPAPFINQAKLADGSIRDLPETYPDAAAAAKAHYRLGAGMYRVCQVKGKWLTFKAIPQPDLIVVDDGAPEPAEEATPE